ncbi:hypothetical protein A3E45_00785 [Candidatus Daviesbacteria bacterium RIFCSPHIGHO2_12_FULL_43_11]|uniref:DUF5667 domain-containing protein n=2 Tax=Candidatus Daviesiibacteriota TaxID=1752718 RepID=A0A1F5K6R5_9BACT|nr:MAG: hypothetical protein UV41_C0048G0005 [Candidatus Daviesbacteria bacterium GW2011_GWA2_42_7]OGE36440.1 MAG: hypothetical protein A3E45_00785 [Candidatus Daviesbacteria bacterium RIFCSPHIGHO2_12_FULL_43_11]
MNIEQHLKILKEDYQKTEPSEKFLSQGWQDLEDKINRLEHRHPNPIYRYIRPLAFAVLLIFVFAGSFTGLAQASQRSLPGEPLYPIKKLSENIISTATGNNLVKVNNRAKEIVDLTKKGNRNEGNLGRAVEEYREEVEKVSKSGKNTKELEDVLESHKREFQEVKEDKSGSNSGTEIDEAIEISKSGSNSGED